MITYKTDAQFVILKSDGKSSERERAKLFAALLADPKVRKGAYLIIDVRGYKAPLTQADVQERARELVATIGPKIGPVCGVLVADTSLRIGLGIQLVAGNMNFRVGVFHDEPAARKWLLSERR